MNYITMKDELIKKAGETVGIFDLKGFKGNFAGSVAAALVTKKGNIYTGICVCVACQMGFCAEHAAAAEMLKNHETEIDMIVAVNFHGKIIPPCGRCREFLYQIDTANLDTQVILSETEIKPLCDLLPAPWIDQFGPAFPE